ncbi:MAG: elongation factor G, partial [Sphaerochaetaceae bacterium]
MSVSTTDLRNIAIIGHNGTGKTTLLEHILFQRGLVARPETIESGKTTSDYTEEEISKQISIHTSLVQVAFDAQNLTFFDTPGTADFIGEVISALSASEAALVIVDARDGAQIETIKLWKKLNDLAKPRAVFINKVDRERGDFFSAFSHLGEQLPATYVPVTIPMGFGENFKGVINLIDKTAYFFDSNGVEKVGEIPAEYQELVEEYNMLLIEAAAEGADELIEKYLEEGTLESDDIRKGLHDGLKENRLVPVFAGSAQHTSGITPLLNFIKDDFPAPLGSSVPILRGTEAATLPIDSSAPPAAFVFKTTIDQFSGKLSFIKVVQGSISGETELVNPEMGKKERPGKVFRMIGKKLEEVDALEAGDVGVITKANNAYTNASLLANGGDFTFAPLSLPSPIYSLAIQAGDKKSEDKMNEALSKVIEEDLTVRRAYNEETKQSTISGMGELHLNMILDKIREKQKVSINTELPKIAYRETITKKSGVVEYTHKKQSGGHGQYGRVNIEIEPLERGEFYSFTNAIRGGNVSKGYMPGIEKGLQDAMSEGFLAGYPLVDIGITIVDGKEHSVDSSEMAFRLAAKGAMKLALEKAGTLLLEPFMKLAVYVEDQYLGDILSDLSGKRGRVL